MPVINHLLSYLYYDLYNFTFICFVGMDRAMLPLVIKQRLALSNFTFIEVSPSWIIINIQNYNMGNYFQAVSLSGGDVTFASHYGFPENPFSNHLKTCNPKSIKPTNYKRGNIINTIFNFQSKKGKPLKCVGCSTSRAINRMF